MISRGRVITVVLLSLVLTGEHAAAQATPPDSVRADSLRMRDTAVAVVSDSAITPPADQARGVDAEVRASLFELMSDRWIPALDRLQWLNSSPVAFSDATAQSGLRGREDMLFLLSQAYYRLGLSEPFRTAAQPLVQSGGRYTSLLQSQLLMDAYRRREHARAMELSRTLTAGTGTSSAVRGLASLIAGLSAYETGDYASARSSFASAIQVGAPYGDYAAYMDALTLLRTDTAQIAPAIAAMQQLASRATGTFADQVRLTAAQLAYEAERFDEAATIAAQIPATSGLEAQATFTRAWALYKAERLQEAGDAFAQFATRHPELPEHEEASLMAAQAMLELERTAEAGTRFQQIADSVEQQVSWLRSRPTAALTEAARRLVADRAAGLLFMGDPSIGKTVALADADGIDWSVFARGTGLDSAAFLPRAAAPTVVGLDMVTARIDSVLAQEVPLESAGTPAMGATPGGQPSTMPAAMTGGVPVAARRLFFTNVSAGSSRANFVRSSQSLYEADVALALVRWRLSEAEAAEARRIALLEALLASLDAENFERTLDELAAARDSLADIAAQLDLTAEWVRRMFRAQLEFTRLLATENQRMVDSVRTNLGGTLQSGEARALEYESSTAQTYQRIANILEGQIEGAIARHPAFALRDSARLRAEAIAALVDEARNALAMARAAVDAELARLRAGGSERVAALRGQVATAEQRRAAAEMALVAVVSTELNARAGELMATLERGSEAAEFGAASASFFQVMEAQRAAAGTSDSSSSATTPAPAVSAGPATGRTPPNKQR